MSSRTIVLLAGVAVGLALNYLIAAPFVPALVWSFTLALLFIPLQSRLEQIIRSPSLTAGIVVFVAALIVVIPVLLVSGILINEAVAGFAQFTAMTESGAWPNVVDENPALSRFLGSIQRWMNVPGLTENVDNLISEWSQKFVQSSITGTVTLLMTFFFLFYALRDRKLIRTALKDYLPFDEAEILNLSKRVTDTVFASVYGTLTVAALQGLLGGLMFWWLGISSPFFWGVLMGLLAIVPFLGAFVIWVPAAIMLALSGDLTSALILTFWGTIIIGLLDNIIYPVLVGRRLRLHSALSFIAIMGGLILFGPSGIVLGPIIMAVSHSMFVILRGKGM